MTATILALLLTALPAQTRTGPASIVAVGCVSRAVQNGSLAGSPGVPPATPETAAALANSQEPTGRLLLESAKPKEKAGDPRADSATYVLEGKMAELERHVGHQVEVTGTLHSIDVGVPAAKSRVQQLQVLSFKMLGSCPKPEQP